MAEGDREALLAWREGDELAGEQLVERHFDRLFRFFRTKVDAGAEDLVQKTFLACLERRDAIDDFGGYLFGAARRVLMRHLRDRHTELKYADFAVLSIRELTSPSGRVATAERDRLLLEGMRSLAVDAQVCLELFYWEGLSTSAIAGALEISVAAVKKRLSRARAALRTKLDELGSDGTQPLDPLLSAAADSVPKKR